MPLVLLAAGLGSRFGGAKQVAPVGPGGEPLGAYTAFDGLRAGFDEVVLLTRPGAERAVREVFAGALGADVPLRAVPQRSALPAGAPVPDDRDRPWGTGHALLAAAASTPGRVAVANADDGYGRGAMVALHHALSNAADGDAVLVTYPLATVLSPHGGVSRGWVRASAAGSEVVEVHDLERRSEGEGASGRTEAGEAVVLPLDTPVSMNLWGLTPGAVAALREEWGRFVRGLDRHPAGRDRAEFQLSTALTELARRGRVRIVPREGGSGWFGITWPDDLARVRTAVEALHRSGAYPVPLAGVPPLKRSSP